MDAERIARLYREGQITGPQIMRAAALGLIEPGDVPPEIGDPSDAVALYAALHQAAEQSVAMNQILIDQLGPQVAYANAVANDQTPDISTAQMLAVVKNLANVLEGTARAASTCLEQLKAHAQLIVGTYDTTARTGGPGPVNTEVDPVSTGE